jgi:uncharacterized membrane protein
MQQKHKTSTGISTHQDFTPPTANSTRAKGVVIPKKNVFQNIFPEEAESKRPSSDTINKPLAFVSAILHDLRNFPQFFENLEKIETVKGSTSKWFFRGKDDFFNEDEISMDLKFQSLNAEKTLVWKTEDTAGFDYTIAIHLEPAQANRGTVVRIMTSYDSKTSEILSKVEKLFGKDANVMAKKNLQRLKAFCETGHVPTIEGQPSGRDSDSVILNPAEHEQTLKH